MSQQLTLEISDEVYSDLLQKANAAGVSVTDWIATILSKQGQINNSVLPSAARQKAAQQAFKNHAGALSLEQATGTDNTDIDADLAKAYSNEY